MDGSAQQFWYVLAEGQSYGPYSSEIMAGFVAEGRIIATSFISNQPEHGYVPAASTPIFQTWIHNAVHAPASHPHATPAPEQHRQTTQQAQPSQRQTHQQSQAASIVQNTLFIVMAEIDPKTGMNFLRALQSFGHVQRLGDSVWLLHAQHSLADVKETLSSTLSKRDRLFIHDCFANQQAWENIGADLDQRIRAIWQTLSR